MSGFNAQWLALREPYDQAARNATVRDALADAFRGHHSLAAVDLACGTGANLRALRDFLPVPQTWRLVDNDLGLLARASAAANPPRLSVVGRPIDLARDLELALDPPLDLVATSALLDLVSEEWLDRFVVETAARRLPVYAALSYDGRVILEPPSSGDREMVQAFNAHQHTDKGFGPALGPCAAARAIAAFKRVGYAIVEGRSDWEFGPEDRAIQESLFTAWSEIATLGSDQAAIPQDWLRRRRAWLDQKQSKLRIGHVDFFARPIGTR